MGRGHENEQTRSYTIGSLYMYKPSRPIFVPLRAKTRRLSLLALLLIPILHFKILSQNQNIFSLSEVILV